MALYQHTIITNYGKQGAQRPFLFSKSFVFACVLLHVLVGVCNGFNTTATTNEKEDHTTLLMQKISEGSDDNNNSNADGDRLQIEATVTYHDEIQLDPQVNYNTTLTVMRVDWILYKNISAFWDFGDAETLTSQVTECTCDDLECTCPIDITHWYSGVGNYHASVNIIFDPAMSPNYPPTNGTTTVHIDRAIQKVELRGGEERIVNNQSVIFKLVGSEVCAETDPVDRVDTPMYAFEGDITIPPTTNSCLPTNLSTGLYSVRMSAWNNRSEVFNDIVLSVVGDLSDLKVSITTLHKTILPGDYVTFTASTQYTEFAGFNWTISTPHGHVKRLSNANGTSLDSSYVVEESGTYQVTLLASNPLLFREIYRDFTVGKVQKDQGGTIATSVIIALAAGVIVLVYVGVRRFSKPKDIEVADFEFVRTPMRHAGGGGSGGTPARRARTDRREGSFLLMPVGEKKSVLDRVKTVFSSPRSLTMAHEAYDEL